MRKQKNQRIKISKTPKKSKPVKTASKTAPKKTELVVKVFDLKGKVTGSIPLPKEIFGQTPNKKLLAQAVRVYITNQAPRTAHTKTRGEVRGGGAKPWRQKGTGRARAGSRRSPLWVGGGITFGPRAKDVKLTLPKKMKRKALLLALSAKASSEKIKVIESIEKIPPKTKPIAQLLAALDIKDNTLLVISEKNQNVTLAARNIPSLSVGLPQNLNAYEIIKNNELLLSREALNKFTQ